MCDCRAATCRLRRSPSMWRAAASCAKRRCTRRVSPAPKPCRPSSVAARSSGWSRAPSPPSRCACRSRRRSKPEIDLVVDDGDNPPLDLRAITAEFAELPWIYFEAPEGALAARYGNPSLPAPEYDLEAARAALRIDAVPDAAWGEPRTRTADENAVGAAPPLPTVGAPVDASTFRFVRDIPAGDAGLVAVRLDEAALAHSRGVASRFADVRVIDADGRQIPYLVERSSEPLSIELSLGEAFHAARRARRVPRASETVYRIGLPYAGLPSPRLVLSTSARVFKRPIQVAVEREPDRRRRDPWMETRGHGDMGARRSGHAGAALVMLAAERRRDANAADRRGRGQHAPANRWRAPPAAGVPDAIVQGTGPAAAARVRAQRPRAAELRPGAARAAGVRREQPSEVSPGPERDERAGARSLIVSPRVFWGILIGAVIVLLGLITRLVRKPSS